jgi:2-methylcitrate dehydratase PrpD
VIPTVGETRILADFCADLDFEDLRKGVVDKAKECFLDWLGSAIGGSNLSPATIVTDIVRNLGGEPESTVVNRLWRTSCVNAALANGIMSHILELDDVHRNSILHPAAPVIPAALALAEREEANGKTLLTAIVAGYEAAIRVGEAVGPSHYKFWHNTGTCGAFGAAAASGRILRMDSEEMASALGSAGTQASGLWQFMTEGAMSKHLHPGKAASNGVLSALLANGRFTGSTSILEGEKGFFSATSNDCTPGRIVEGLGENLKVLETSFKVHASCRHTHPAVDAALQIMEREDIRSEEITKVVVNVYPDAVKIAGIENPRTPYEAKFSLKYCVCAGLSKGRLGVDEFSEELLHDQGIRSLMRQCDIVIDSELGEMYPAIWPSTVELIIGRGKRYTASVDYPLGDPENPLPLKDLVAKFRALTDKVLSENKAESLIDTALRLEKLTDISRLTELLRPSS